VREISATRRKAAGASVDAEILENFPGSGENKGEGVLARTLAADMLGVSERYVVDAFRLKNEAPELFQAGWSPSDAGSDTTERGQSELETTRSVTG